MGGTNTDTRRRGLAGYQGIFLALTLIVMIIILITTRDLATAVLVIGLITNFLIISSQMTLMKDRQIALNGRVAKIDRGLNSSVAVNPTPGFVMVEGFEDGPVDTNFDESDDEYEDSSNDEYGDSSDDKYGDSSDDEDLAGVEIEDQLRDQGRGWPDSCRDRDSYYPVEADEQVAYQVRARNVPERVWAGTLKRKENLEPYFREELDEEEDKRWWGRGEF